MRTINEQELKDILDKHGKWLRDEENGERANLRYANLRYANLRSANLRYANLSYADLSSADLSSANLRYANLRYANLRSANLNYADLRYANLRSADLVIFQFQRHTAYYTLDGALRIGCLFMPITEWKLGFKEIGKSEKYTDVQIKIYGTFIEQCYQLFKNKG